MKSKGSSQSVFLKRVHDTIRHYDMVRKGDRVLVAVSGGPDSVCLLDALYRLRGKLGIELAVANIDHGIRGAESKRDSEFAKALARKLGLKLIFKKIDVPASRSAKLSIEENARAMRYAFLCEAATGMDAGVIATGHNLDDQAETVLMRMILGSSTQGIAGIPPVRSEGDIRIVRPLIRTEKRDILGYLKKNRIVFVKDSSNTDERILRNSIRIKLIPLLEKYNPRLKRSLANLADSTREDLRLMEDIKEKISAAVLSPGCGEVSLRLDDILMQPRAVRREVFKKALAVAGGNVKKLTYRHWMDVDLLVRSGVSGKALDLPGDIRVCRKPGEIIFRKRSTDLTNR